MGTDESVVVYRSEGERVVDQWLWHGGGWKWVLALLLVLLVVWVWPKSAKR